jgi:multicomponent Na+:H+ antiporter subunit D
MSWLLPLPAVVPLLTAALTIALRHLAGDRLHTALTLGGLAAALGFAIAVLRDSMALEPMHWFGGWTPRGGVALGIVFAADPLGAGLAVLGCALTLAALVYSATFIESEKRSYDTLVLVLCGGVCGFGLSGDLFNMFVWLELLGVASYALTGFDIRQMRALQGAVNFAVVNSVGGYLLLIGIALLYARTGALNLAQIGRAVSGHAVDGLVIVAMTLIFGGFFCKAAVVPFHFWLADAYAVAPAPICAIFAGVVTDIGLFGVARVWFTVFETPFAADQRIVGDTLLWLGLVTALVGGIMALLQRHLKRLLAFSVICHIGLMLVGVALLSERGVAGAALMLLAHGLVTGGLFLVAGMLAVAGRSRWTAALWIVGAVALIGPPYVGVYNGHALIDAAAGELGRHWVQPCMWLAAALAGAALLRAGAQVFLGIGPGDDWEALESRDSDVRVLRATASVVLALGVATSLVPGLAERALYGAARFRGAPVPPTLHLGLSLPHSSLESLLYGSGALLLAAGLAAYTTVNGTAPIARVAWPLRVAQTGVIGDYVMWLVVGIAVIGGVWAITLR